MNFKSHMEAGIRQTLFGINVRCHHLSWFTMEGEAKRDYPASISHQSSWYKEYRYVEDHFSRIHYLLDGAQRICDLLVLNPVESYWGAVNFGVLVKGIDLEITDPPRKTIVWGFNTTRIPVLRRTNQLYVEYG